MITGKEDLVRTITEVYLMEKGINQFYTELSVKAQNAGARKTFTELANWEAEHMRYIQDFYQSLMGEREPLPFEEFAQKSRPDTAEGGMSLSELERKIDGFVFMDDISAINFALKIEGSEYNLYRKISTQTIDTNVKALCEEFMGWEQKHIEHLKNLKQQLLNLL